MKITRRKFAIGTAALAFGGVIAGVSSYLRWDLVRPARADDPPLAELMKPNPMGEMSLGDEHAPVTIIEYASMTCPHCAHFSMTTFPELKKRYIETGKVRFIFREFPLDQLAAAGFMLARCASPDKYFPLIETLFASQRDWVVQHPLDPLLVIAKQAGFTKETFEACLTNQKILDGIEQVRDQGAKQFGVDSTPTFFVNGKRVAGDVSIEEMSKQIDAYLKG